MEKLWRLPARSSLSWHAQMHPILKLRVYAQSESDRLHAGWECQILPCYDKNLWVLN